MLKTRIIPTLLFKDVGLVKGVGFDSWRRVGSAVQAVKVYNMREVDELIFLDITATINKRKPDFQQVSDLSSECFMPMTVGGGIHDIDDIYGLLAAGADKVSINTASIENPAIIAQAVKRFGSQCVVVSIDAKHTENSWEVFTHCGKHATGVNPVEHARNVEALGAGEIIITSIDHDGMMNGYNIELTKSVSAAVDIPVIASGGAGCYAHMVDVLQKTHASAVAAASIFHFTEQTPYEAKRYLRNNGINVRI